MSRVLLDSLRLHSKGNSTLRERRNQQCGISYFHAHYRRNRKAKSRIMKNTGNGWMISTGQDGCSFPDRLPIAPMESISCSLQARAKRIAAQDPHHVRGIRSMEVLEWNPHRAFRLNGPTIADVERMAVGNS